MAKQLDTLDATAQARLVKSGEITSLELVEAAIARIEERDPQVNALCVSDFAMARDRAKGALTGAFAGVPFLVKDLIPYPGLRYSLGSRLFAQGVPALASAYSKRLDDAGLVVLGKSTTSELGLLGSTETLLAGRTHNPWGPNLSAGGSSGGAAAAVASGMVPMAHASDGGGSIRIPASMNGLFGFKPGSRRIAGAGVEDMDGLVVEHCVSWSVRDSARLFALTENSASDSDSEYSPVGFVEGPSSKRLRIGYYSDTLMGEAPSASVLSALGETIALCRELGHEVFEIAPPAIVGRAVSDGFFTMAGAGITQLAAMMEPIVGRSLGGDDLEPFTLSLLEWFGTLSETDVAAALAAGKRAGSSMRSYLEDFDVLLCPTIPDEPHEFGWLSPSLDRETILARTERLAGYTAIHNMAGVPAMSVPLAVSPEGLPIGSHFAAKVGSEATLFALAYELEQARPWSCGLPFFSR